MPTISSPRPSAAIILVLALFSLSLGLFWFLQYQTDTNSYIQAVEIILGQKDIALDSSHRLAKFYPFYPIALWAKLGLPIYWGIILQQWLSYFLSALALYKIAKLLYPQQVWAPILLLTASLMAPPYAIFSTVCMTDGSGWAMQLWASYWALYFIQKARPNYSAAFWLGCFMGVGILVKESILMAGLLWALLLLFRTNLLWPQKFRLYLATGSGFLLLFLLGSLWAEWQFGKSLFSWWRFAHTDPIEYTIPIIGYFQQLARSLDLLLFPFFFVLLSYFKKPFQYREWAILATVGLAYLLFPFAWPYYMDRILMMCSLPLLFLYPRLLQYFSGPSSFGLLLLAGGGSLFMSYRIYKYAEGGWLIWGYLLFAALLSILLFPKLRNKLP